ncbi:MAG: homoaconitate hydratase family protein [Candidatus Lokiarchaeota archaeon]|nr:homoaconitate hydratase family protein [Candidatus Lokiarchaeota archaeon]
MGTIAEKILARHTDKEALEPGEIVTAKVDLVMLTEQLGRRIYKVFSNLVDDDDIGVWDKDKIVSVLDHWVPAPHIDAAEIHKICRNFTNKYDITHALDMKRGICHQVMIEGYVKPGMLVVGSDSHTVTYGALNCFSSGLGSTDIAITMAMGENWFKVPKTMKINLKGKKPQYIYGKDIILKIITDLTAEGATYYSMEFVGEATKDLSMDSRFTISNMSVEAGAKCGIFEFDEKTRQYLNRFNVKDYITTKSDKDAKFEMEYDLDISKLDPQVAKPHSPANSVDIGEIEGQHIDQALIGSCTNGRLEDLRTAAEILKGKKVHPEVRLIVVPASRNVYLDAVKKGIIESLINSDALITNPTCGACIGGHLGILASNEVCISTTNRNFKSRMGHPTSKIFLANAITVAASAIKGEITDPRDYMEE